MDDYRQLMEYLADMRRAGVTHLAHCQVPEFAPRMRQASSAKAESAISGESERSIAASAGAPSERIRNANQVEPSPTTARVSDQPSGPKPGQPLPNQTLASPVSASTAPATRQSTSDTGRIGKTSFETLPDLSDEHRRTELAQLATEVASCNVCSELCANRTQTVFGVGSERPRLCFFGEAPGADEDRLGEPFVGRAGQLLNKIIEAMTLKRGEVYILNSVKCRPPGNRNPEPTEIDQCRQYWNRQLEILRPEFICCLGSVGAKTLLERTESVGRMRGRWFEYRGAQVMVTYHPAYLLRNEFAKRYVWDDIKRLMEAMGLKR